MSRKSRETDIKEGLTQYYDEKADTKAARESLALADKVRTECETRPQLNIDPSRNRHLGDRLY